MIAGGTTHADDHLISISLEDWMKSAACDLQYTEAFIERAVGLAWILTKHICQLIAGSFDEVKLERQIVAETILIFVEQPSLMTQSQSVQYSHCSIHAVEMLSVNAHQTATLSGAKSAQSPDAVCVALGKMLLRIFSRG